jgi:hypothetical protein
MFTTKDTMQPVDATELAAIEGGVTLLGPILGPIRFPGGNGPFVPGPFNPFPPPFPGPFNPFPGPYIPGPLL